MISKIKINIQTTNSNKTNRLKSSNIEAAFTMIEILVVITVIGIIAAISAVSYSASINRAKTVSLQSDLSNAADDLELFNYKNKQFPVTVSTDCTASPTTTTNLCLKTSSDNADILTEYTRPTPQSYVLTTTKGSLMYHITESVGPTTGVYFNPAEWITIGSQTWAKTNLNVGIMITGATEQTNNVGTNVVEKYCYGDSEVNCTADGGIYQWDEAMKYGVDGSRGICPSGSHVPSDNDWKTLEVQLGMTQEEANLTDMRGTDQGVQLRPSGSSGLDIPSAGYRAGGSFTGRGQVAYLWSSTESSTTAWYRLLLPAPNESTVFRGTLAKSYGYSVRCLRD